MTTLRHNRLSYPVRKFATRDDWERYAAWLRRHTRVSLALDPAPPRTPLRAKVTDPVECEDVVIEKVAFESLPGYFVTGNLFRPLKRDRKKRMPVILCPHGHWQYGRLHDESVSGSVVARCVQLARMGAIVLSYDMIGYNDSCQLPQHRGMVEDHAWGLSTMGLQTWNSVRALDFLLELPGADAKRVGVTGCSGGGTQTFALGAVDDRVTAAAPICMVGYNFQGGCVCENAPLLRIDATSVELARLMAPKPVFLGSCTGDWTKDTPTLELPAVRAIHKLYGKAANVRGKHVDDGHNYNRPLREAVYGFFNRHLFGAKSTRAVRESPWRRPDLRDQMVWHGKDAPPAMSTKQLHDLWRESRRKALRKTRQGDLIKLLPHAMAIGSDGVGDVKPRGAKFNIDGDVITVTAARDQPKDRTDEVTHYHAYNPMPMAERVHEVIAAAQRAGKRVTLRGKGKAGTWCVLAASVCDNVKAVEADVKGTIDLPAFEQVGGMKTVKAALGRRWKG